MFKPLFSSIAIIALGLALALALSQGLALAQLAQRGGPVKSEDAYNPKPDPADLIFPMPCDLKMVFKVVSFPVTKRLEDMKARLGTEGGDTKGFLDRKYVAHLGSALSLSDLSPEHRAIADNALRSPDSGDGDGTQIFLFGKYEVTNAQWDAVMTGCAPLKPDAALPKTNISWYEALSFTEKYMRYLLKERPDVLPSFPDDLKNVGLIRLPTDAEWEYAAKGGHAVDSNKLRMESLFPLNNLPLSDYGLFHDGVSAAAASPSRIGRYRPNPLGVYDTVGNVAEMTSDFFKMSVGGRLHGATGGFVRKGGSFRADSADILPGRRVEVPLFVREGPSVSTDLGFRLSLSAMAAPGGSRFKELAAEWEKSGRAIQSDSGESPMDKLNNLIKEAETDSERAAFESLKTDLENFGQAAQREKAASVRAHCKSLIHTAYSIRNTDRRKSGAELDVRNATEDIKTATEELRTARGQERAVLNRQLEQLKKVIASINNDISVLDEAINNQFGYYKIMLEDATEFDLEILKDQMQFVWKDIKGNDIYSQEMRKCFKTVYNHLGYALNGEYERIDVEEVLS
jgi:formylglycine-generating enzyme required for sulfatase activity